MGRNAEWGLRIAELISEILFVQFVRFVVKKS